MHINLKNDGDIFIMELSDEIDLYNSPELRNQLTTAISRGEKKIVIDFANVKYIDSSGLATLIEGLQKMNREKGELKLCALRQSIRDIFEVARLDDVFAIYETQKDAVDEFKQN